MVWYENGRICKNTRFPLSEEWCTYETDGRLKTVNIPHILSKDDLDLSGIEVSDGLYINDFTHENITNGCDASYYDWHSSKGEKESGVPEVILDSAKCGKLDLKSSVADKFSLQGVEVNKLNAEVFCQTLFNLYNSKISDVSFDYVRAQLLDARNAELGKFTMESCSIDMADFSSSEISSDLTLSTIKLKYLSLKNTHVRGDVIIFSPIDSLDFIDLSGTTIDGKLKINKTTLGAYKLDDKTNIPAYQIQTMEGSQNASLIEALNQYR